MYKKFYISLLTSLSLAFCLTQISYIYTITKVSNSRELLLSEVVGAVGNIGMHTRMVSDPKIREAVDIYNSAMGLIGLKNLGQGGYKFVKNLPAQTKKFLQQNTGLRNELQRKYLEWKLLTTNLDNLSDAERQLIVDQEQVWKVLKVGDRITETGKLHFLLGSNKQFLELLGKVKVKGVSVNFEKFVERFESLCREVPAGSIKAPDAVMDDYAYLITNHLDDYLHRGKGQQMADFLDEMLQSRDKFKAGATTLEVIRNHKKYISSKYSSLLSDMELEDLISATGGAGDFRFDIKWVVQPTTNMKPKRPISIYVDTKNYVSASSMFQDLGQFKAYIHDIDSFDQLYIIQQGGRGVTKEQIVAQLEKVIAKDAYGVFKANEELWLTMRIKTFEELKKLCDLQELSNNIGFQLFRDIILLTY